MPDKTTIYVTPLAGGWSVMIDGAYLVNPTNKRNAQRAAEEEAKKLRAEGHDDQRDRQEAGEAIAAITSPSADPVERFFARNVTNIPSAYSDGSLIICQLADTSPSFGRGFFMSTP